MVTAMIQTLQGTIHEGMVLSNTFCLYFEPYAIIAPRLLLNL